MARPKKTTETKVEVNTTAVKTADAVKTAAPVAEKSTKAAPKAQKTAVKAEKPAAKKAAAPKTAKPATAKKTESTVNVYIQQNGAEITTAALIEKAKADAAVKSAKNIDIYIRPEINTVYYVIDGEIFGNFELC